MVRTVSRTVSLSMKDTRMAPDACRGRSCPCCNMLQNVEVLPKQHIRLLESSRILPLCRASTLYCLAEERCFLRRHALLTDSSWLHIVHSP